MTAVRETTAALCGKMLSGVKGMEQKAGVMYHHDNKKKKKQPQKKTQNKIHTHHEKGLFSLLQGGVGVLTKWNYIIIRAIP